MVAGLARRMRDSVVMTGSKAKVFDTVIAHRKMEELEVDLFWLSYYSFNPLQLVVRRLQWSEGCYRLVGGAVVISSLPEADELYYKREQVLHRDAYYVPGHVSWYAFEGVGHGFTRVVGTTKHGLIRDQAGANKRRKLAHEHGGDAGQPSRNIATVLEDVVDLEDDVLQAHRDEKRNLRAKVVERFAEEDAWWVRCVPRGSTWSLRKGLGGTTGMYRCLPWRLAPGAPAGHCE